MKNYIAFISKHRKKLFVLLMVINITALMGILQLDINADFNIFKIDQSAYQETLDEMNTIFGGSTQTVMLIETDNTDFYEVILETETLLSRHQNITYTSPIKILELAQQGGFNESDLGSISPVVKKDNKTFITFILDVGEDFDFSLLQDGLTLNGFTTYFSGDKYMQFEIVNLVMSILLIIPPLALTLILLTFRSQLNSFKAALLSVIPAGLAALWTLGFVGWFGGQVSILTVLAPIFAIVIGSADGLHFVTHMEDEFGSNKSNVEALVYTLKIVGMPMAITTTTSIAGFIGLLMIDTASIKDLAIYASLGVFLAGVITWYVLPLIFTGDVKLKYRDKSAHTNWIMKMWGKKSIITAILLVVSASLFIPKIQTEFNQLLFFRDFTTVQKNFKRIVEINDGAVPLYYYGESQLDTLDETFIHLQSLLDTLENDEHVKKVVNPLKIIQPTGQMDMTTLSSAKDFVQLKGDRLYYRFMIFPNDLDNDTLNNIEETALTFENQLSGKLIGSQFLMKEMNQSMVKGQVLSIATTFVLISVMLLFTLKSIKLTAIASLPIILTSIILYGFLGITQISLNLMTCTIFSITLGIGVDYAIHYTSVYKHFSEEGADNPKELALKYSSRPIIANAFGLSLGLTALWISPLLVHLHISTLMWVSMMVAVFMSLTLLPTLLPKTAKKTQ